jgi:hypothetical protein
VRWDWFSGMISVLIGAFILVTFFAFFNYLAPSGRVTVTGRVVEVTPNVTGQIVVIPVKFPAEISILEELSRDSRWLGMSGTATAFASNAGVIGLLAATLVWVSAYTAYL